MLQVPGPDSEVSGTFTPSKLNRKDPTHMAAGWKVAEDTRKEAATVIQRRRNGGLIRLTVGRVGL